MAGFLSREGIKDIHQCSSKKNEVNSHSSSQSGPLSFDFVRFAPKFMVVCTSHRKLNKMAVLLLFLDSVGFMFSLVYFGLGLPLRAKKIMKPTLGFREALPV